MNVVRISILAGLVLSIGGCATVDPTPDYERTKNEVRAATGAVALYDPGEEEQVRERVMELLDDGLTSETAVQVALLNNRDVQAMLFEIGVSRADAVQAGLLSNPSLEGLVRLPVGGGNLTSEGGLLQSLLELWQLPVRKRVAEIHVERTVLDVAHRAAAIALQAKAAYATSLASIAALSVEEENLGTARDVLELTRERRDAGAATQVDVNAARSAVLEQLLLMNSARFIALDAKRRLALALGISTPPREIVLAETLAAPADHGLDLPQLLVEAQQHRLELRMAQKAVEAAEHALGLERRQRLRNVAGGGAIESEGGDWAIGPAIELEIPIFDQNQAQIAKAEYRHAQSVRELAGIAVQVVQQVQGAFARYALAQDTARLYREELLPLREASLDLARESFAAGKTGFLSVLEAQNRLLAARRDYVDRLAMVATSIRDLEASCGRPFGALLESNE